MSLICTVPSAGACRQVEATRKAAVLRPRCPSSRPRQVMFRPISRPTLSPVTDDQIFLERLTCSTPVSVLPSTPAFRSRVGGNAQIKAMKKVAGTLNRDLLQYRELQGLCPKVRLDPDADTKRPVWPRAAHCGGSSSRTATARTCGEAGCHPVRHHPRLSKVITWPTSVPTSRAFTGI